MKGVVEARKAERVPAQELEPGCLPVPVVIPAFEPEGAFAPFCRSLLREGVGPLVVVDDGSGDSYQGIFDEIRGLAGCTVLRHAVNLGKGRALKDAFNYVLVHYPNALGVVTADSDGQHTPQDIKKCVDALQAEPHQFILGCRVFDGDGVPWKSRFGNRLTRKVFSYLCGLQVSDTQTGLRAIPAAFMGQAMATKGERFEYETNMLLAWKEMAGTDIAEVPIQTVYDSKDSHKTHFDPLRDSLRIYRVLLAYALSALAATAVDFLVFAAVASYGHGIWAATAAARACSAVVNFTVNRNVVFRPGGSVAGQFARYLALVAVSGAVSASAVGWLAGRFPAGVIVLKAAVETCLFFFNYYIQRVFVFARGGGYRNKLGGAVQPVPGGTRHCARSVELDSREKGTDWTAYYGRKRSWFSVFTQKFTMKEIIKQIGGSGSVSIMELGGGGSCFAAGVCRAAAVDAYDIVDSNELAVTLFNQMCLDAGGHTGILCNLLDEGQDAATGRTGGYDFVYSIGLVEHFQGDEVETMIRRHFEYCRPGGTVMVSFPTPTVKYRFVRKCMELAGAWQFWDEHPLKFEDVESLFGRYGAVKCHYINRKLFLTQMIVVAKKL